MYAQWKMHCSEVKHKLTLMISAASVLGQPCEREPCSATQNHRHNNVKHWKQIWNSINDQATVPTYVLCSLYSLLLYCESNSRLIILQKNREEWHCTNAHCYMISHMISHMITEEYWNQLKLVSSPYPTPEEGKGLMNFGWIFSSCAMACTDRPAKLGSAQMHSCSDVALL